MARPWKSSPRLPVASLASGCRAPLQGLQRTAGRVKTEVITIGEWARLSSCNLRGGFGVSMQPFALEGVMNNKT